MIFHYADYKSLCDVFIAIFLTGSLNGPRRASSLSKVSSLDQPIVSREKVKSSGYQEAPRRTMLQPQISKQAPRSPAKSKPKTEGLFRFVLWLTYLDKVC